METSILYLQANEGIASNLKDRFNAEGIEFINATSAAQAFDLLREREFYLILSDGYIPDMRVHGSCRMKFPRNWPDILMRSFIPRTIC